MNNCSQSTNILVNDKLVLSDIELKDNDVLSVSNRKFLWSFNASNFKNKYRRITTFSNRGRNKTNQKIDGRERKSLPLSAYLPISAGILLVYFILFISIIINQLFPTFSCTIHQH